ncbi:hypothetical protein SAMN04488524_0246 [Pedobacter africanus]|uniref:NlpE N-terminal domain-containing protein n=2 Tax=Pedobacter africanus TaxID=151894 RepID=A0A1W1YXT1_9SPHI|nr:hypothetical protein SAMN04488524_0246 [Pedobacter africanus]
MIKPLCLVIVAVLCACRNGAPDHKTLYRAIHTTDTAMLNIHLTEKEFYGQLEINYKGLYTDSGNVTGIIKGDTLRGTYRYRHYGIETWHTIPIALLKKGHRLIMGEGETEIYMNMRYFRKNAPINYQNPKFVFELSQ